MYKVFVNDKPIILTDSLQKKNLFTIYFFDAVNLDAIVARLKEENLEGVVLVTSNLENAWEIFTQKFEVVTAAGGLVLNSKEEILFIYRGNKWDLPKGKIEKGESIEETAIREVEEECGITNLKLDRFLLKTYHMFSNYDGVDRIKETYWYLMHSDYSGTLTPQLEEGITKVIFKNREEVKDAIKDSYANIELVYKEYRTHFYI